MEIDLLQWSIILVLSISLWLPQLLITDALQVENNSTAYSCEENGTFTDIESARQQPWPKTFEPFDTTSQAEFTPLVTASHSLSGVTPNSTKTPDKSTTTIQINPTPSIIRFIIAPSPSLPSSPMQSNLQSSQLLLFSSSSTMAPTPSLNSMTSSTLKPVTTLELISNKQNAASTMSIFQLSSSPVQAPFVNTDTVIMPPSSSLSPNVNDNVTFPLNYSHTVSSDKPTHHGHQPSGSQQINHVITTAITPTLTDNLPDELSINPNNGAFDNIKSSPTLTTIEVSTSPSLTNQPNTSDTNETSESHMGISPSPSSSSYFPALSGTISIIPSDSSLDSSTTDFPFTSNPVDNSEIDNSFNNNETNNHGENSPNHHGIPQAATSNSTKCDPSDTRFSQPATSGFLVRSVLKRDEDLPLNADNLTIFFETRLAEVFTKAYHKQFNKLNGGSDVIKKDVHVKLWNLFWNNSTNDIHIIYQIEQDKEKILPRDLITVLSHVTPQEMSNILGYNVTIKAEPYVNTLETKNNLAAALQDLDWLPLVMIILSLMVFIFCSLLTLIVWRKNRRLLSSSSNQLSSGEPARSGNIRSKASHMVKPLKASTKENLVNWRKVSAPGSKRSFLGSHGSNVGLNISGGCSATSGTIDSNHEFEYLSFDSPESSLKLRTAEYRSRRPFTAFPNGLGSQSRLELTKEKVIPIGELDEIAEMSSNDSSHDHHHHHPSHQVPGSRVTYVTTKEEMIGDYENPLMRSGIDEVDCTVPQLIQVHISEQTQNIIQAIRSELKKFNPITGNVQSQSQSSTAHFKEPSTTSDA
ncbi:probable serine/threonine-protein kinase DDB_G0277071 [Tetranychus urticae]|uniref:probable serine/threonine-protein kinase DDB_G0277071 n=1 Tax=Tetranychus urticae TaxID=32264 RepID=UPI00077BDF5D|nr:probable serine/threonine-protein kinase DDB_G0277071 [Tetranychus urticae]